MVFEFIAGSVFGALSFGAWLYKRKEKREITNMADRMRRGGGFIQLPGETDEEYVERARVWDREQQRAAEQHARDHPEQWDPEVYEKLIKPTFKYPPMK